MKKWDDFDARYVDGSPGSLMTDLWQKDRYEFGKAKGKSDAIPILSNLKEGETIKIVTHSMGGVFGRGYVEGLRDELFSIAMKHNSKVLIAQAKAKLNGEEYNGPSLMKMPEIEVVGDIAQYGDPIKAVRGVPTYQMNGEEDELSGYDTWPGSTEVGEKEGKGHDMKDYDASDLPSTKGGVKNE